MKLKLKFELFYSAAEKPLVAAVETPGKESLRLIARKLSEEIAAGNAVPGTESILAHLDGIDPEWTGDFLKSI